MSLNPHLSDTHIPPASASDNASVPESQLPKEDLPATSEQALAGQGGPQALLVDSQENSSLDVPHADVASPCQTQGQLHVFSTTRNGQPGVADNPHTEPSLTQQSLGPTYNTGDQQPGAPEQGDHTLSGFQLRVAHELGLTLPMQAVKSQLPTSLDCDLNNEDGFDLNNEDGSDTEETCLLQRKGHQQGAPPSSKEASPSLADSAALEQQWLDDPAGLAMNVQWLAADPGVDEVPYTPVPGGWRSCRAGTLQPSRSRRASTTKLL